MRTVLYPRTVAAIEMASKIGPFFFADSFAVGLAAAGGIQSK
jgi:hypothetical protein